MLGNDEGEPQSVEENESKSASIMNEKRRSETELTVRLPGKFGKLLVCYRRGRLTRVVLSGGAAGKGRQKEAGSRVADADRALERSLRADFRSYFSGRKVAFNYPVDTEESTPFQTAVWAAMRKIPYGETRSYGWIAERIGKPRAARAVGNACGKNPLFIVQPCHRVVGADGRLGGFSAGLELKKALLKLEGVDPACLRMNKQGGLRVNTTRRCVGGYRHKRKSRKRKSSRIS